MRQLGLRSRTPTEQRRSRARRRALVARVHVGEHLAGLDRLDRASRGRRRRPRGRSSSSFVRRPRTELEARRCRSRARRGATTTPARGARHLADDRARGRVRRDPDRRPARGSSARTSARGRAVRHRRLGAFVDPRRRRRPRSESASRRAQASRTSSVKSGGPCPAIVSTASRTSSAFPTAAPSGWSMSVSRHTTSRPVAAAEVDHLLGEDARVVERLHERAVADLHVEDDRVGPAPRASST